MTLDEPQEEGLYVERDHAGIQMAEVESLERVIEGLKIAADGARHCAAFRNKDGWEKIADNLDRMRGVAVTLSGTGNVNAASTRLSIITLALPIEQAFRRYVEGLRQAMGGAKQMATYHRMSMEWLSVVHGIESILEGGKALMRVQMNPLRPGLISGLVH